MLAGKGGGLVGLFKKPVLRLVGDRGVLIEYGDAIDPEINRRVRIMAAALKEAPREDRLAGVEEVIPTYRSLLINYDPLTTDPGRIKRGLENLETRLGSIVIPEPEKVEIPVCYGGELGPDLEFVARHTGLETEEIIRRHSAPLYQIYMIGFTPGFPFLGGMDESLTTPRLSTPRTLVPAGSVGIANNQTGMYPIDSPGGWQLIGRTPLRLFRPEKENPFLYRAGDLIEYNPISRPEFDRLAALAGAVAKGD